MMPLPLLFTSNRRFFTEPLARTFPLATSSRCPRDSVRKARRQKVGTLEEWIMGRRDQDGFFKTGDPVVKGPVCWRSYVALVIPDVTGVILPGELPRVFVEVRYSSFRNFFVASRLV